MKRNIINSKLTKDMIFSKVSQISIFSTYTGIDINVIQNCIDEGEFVSSPFRDDAHPSFGFRYDNRNKLKGKDFAGYWWGDCIDAAATVLSELMHRDINVSNNNDFQFILKHIVYTFRHIIYGEEKDDTLEDNIIEALNNIKQRKSVIEIVTRQWNKKDSIYWKQFGVDLSFLNTHFVYPIDQFYINRFTNPIPKYFYDKTPNDLCYAYILGQDKRGIVNIKLYFPNRDKKKEIKFITNSNHIEGVYNLDLPKYDYIIITKSTKDRLAIESYLKSCNIDILYRERNNLIIGVINIPCETYKLKDKEYQWLVNKLDINGKLISLMDNDRTGLMEAVILKNEFDIIPIIIPKEYNAKDFSELRASYSNETINKLLKETIKYIQINYENSESFWNTGEDNFIPY